MRTIFAAIAFSTLMAFPALADDPASAAPSAADAKMDPRLAAALDLLEATNAKHNVSAVMDALTDTMLSQVKKDHPGADEKMQKAFASAFKEELATQLPELLKAQAAVYAEHFSEAELKALAAFYRSDVGKHYISEIPAIMKEIMPLAFKWGQGAGLSAAQKALEKLKKDGNKL